VAAVAYATPALLSFLDTEPGIFNNPRLKKRELENPVENLAERWRNPEGRELVALERARA